MMLTYVQRLMVLAMCLVAGLALSACGDAEEVEVPPICEETCATANDGVCDDGGEGAEYDSCDYGSDCSDCGERVEDEAPTEPLPLEPICEDTCATANDNVCDDGSGSAVTITCRPGTDCSDCGPREDIQRCEHDDDCGLWRVCSPKSRCVVPEYDHHTEHIVLTEATVPAGELVEASIELPEGTGSAVILVEAADTRASITLEKVYAPIGQLIYSSNAHRAGRISFLPDGVGGQFAIFFRNSPEYVFRDGTHRLQITSSTATDVTISALVKRLPTEPRGGRLQLNFWFPNDSQVSATSAPTHRNFQVALREVRRIYAHADLEIHKVTYNTLQGSYADSLAVPQDIGPLCSDMRQSMTTAALPGLNLVMVNHFASGGLLGVSCGIPGMPSWPGISSSGVTVAGFLLNNSPYLLGSVMAHEAGHYLGLFHATESHGLLHDPIEDTPECTLAQDLDGNRWLSSEECIDHGSDNTMFWTSPNDGSFVRGDISPGQRFVLMRNPMVETY